MTQFRNLNFSNQDLRNRSFKGLDLSGADFRGADICGCDFREALLTQANFTGAKVGVSRDRIWGLIGRCGGVAIAVTASGALAGILGVVGTGLVAIAITRSDLGIIAATIAGMSAYVGCHGLLIFLGGDFIRGVFLGGFALVVLGMAAMMFVEVLNELETLTVTSFENADLTAAIFDGELSERNSEIRLGQTDRLL